MFKFPLWTYEEDRIILQTEDREELRNIITERTDQSVTMRIKRLQRMGYTLRKLNYEEAFIQYASPTLTHKQIAEHLGIRIHDIPDRLLALGDRAGNELIKINKKVRDGFLQGIGKKKIMKNNKLKSHEYEAQRIIFESSKDFLKKLKAEEDKEKKNQEIIKQLAKADKKRKQGDLILIDYKDAPLRAISTDELAKDKYRPGCWYCVEWIEKRPITIMFKGFLIQETESHITLKSKKNIRESFMKVDFCTGEKEIKEI